jgi:hypothetical protein
MEFSQFSVRTNQMEACDMMDATDALFVSLPSADVHLAEHHIHDEDKVASSSATYLLLHHIIVSKLVAEPIAIRRQRGDVEPALIL